MIKIIVTMIKIMGGNVKCGDYWRSDGRVYIYIIQTHRRQNGTVTGGTKIEPLHRG